MINTIKKWLGITSVDYAQLVRNGALILDVRSKGEYTNGHIQGSVNIAVDQLRGCLDRIPNKHQVVITCCASGMRSSLAKRILSTNGYQVVYNGGSWFNLKQKIK